jgi:hypothetical protein
MTMSTPAGGVTGSSAGNSTASVLNGSSYIYASSSAISYTIGYTSSGATAMVYEAHFTCEEF